jgi:adenylate cyclase
VADIFLSYSKKSRAQTEQLATELQAKGFSVWWDTSLVAGDSFREVIMSELARARAAIIIWDAASVKSEWVCSEASRARARGILIPVRVDGIRSHDIPPPFDSLHTEFLSNRVAIDASLAKLGVMPIDETNEQPSLSGALPTVGRSALPLPDKPSIAVLPFTNMSGSPEEDYFGDGIAEDIISMVSRSPWLFVIARNSSFTYKGHAVDVKRVGRELGVRYVLEGSVRRGGNRARIVAELVEAATGNHLWSERYDRDLNDVFAVQDEIAQAVVMKIVPTVAEVERHRAVRKPPESLGAWEAYHRGRWHMGQFSTEQNEIAKSFFRRAVDLDPNFGRAHAVLAIAIFLDAAIYRTSGVDEVSDKVLAIAQRAISLDPLDEMTHLAKGWGLFLLGDRDGQFAKAQQALAINPNCADAAHFLAVTMLYSGKPREALETIHKAMRLDPNDPANQYLLVHIAIAHYFMHEYEASIEASREALRSYPDHSPAYHWFAAALGQVGRLDEARKALQKAIAIMPNAFDIYKNAPAFLRPEDIDHLVEGLRKAGWEG